jgi:prephenate dehydratase
MKTMPKVAYYGEPGSYSEQAAMQYFGSFAALKGFRFLAQVFESVDDGMDYGVVPIENSIEGPVTQTYDLLLESNLTITGEEIVKIEHCLISNPGVNLGDVANVYSHPQALGQCRKYLEGRRLNAIPFYDTAGSVKMLREKKLKDSAAIASRRAAKAYGMKVLAQGIQSSKNNFTRFMVVAKQNNTKKWNKTSIAFEGKDRPGSLFHALNCFAKNKVNLLHIASRPIPGMPWEYNFYVDCEGSMLDGNISKAIRELHDAADFVKILGSYRSAR